MARRKVNLAGCARRGRLQGQFQILEWLGNSRRVRFELADEQSSVHGDSGVQSDAVHRAVAVIVEAPADAGPESGEPALGRPAVFFETPQPHAHRQYAGLIGHFMGQEEDVAVAA
jgi:hypothetical protein